MKSLLIVLTLMSSTAFAKAPKMGMKLLGDMDKVEAKCPGLNITSDQKVAIKKSIVDLKTAAIPPRKDVKQARKAKRKVMMNPATTREEAIAASKEVRTISKPLRQLRKSTMLDIQFDILSGDQRVKLLKCLKKPGRGGRGRG